MIAPRAARLRVGDCDVDAARRIVVQRDGSKSTRLTVKAMQVLLALLERHGAVVSRETLFDLVWPDTMPTDDVLTQAVTQLRKAFGDDRDAPRYIETIAKGGYRLVADFEWTPVEVPEAGVEAPSHPGDTGTEHPATVRRRRHAFVVPGIAFAALALLTLLAIAWHQQRPLAAKPVAEAPSTDPQQAAQPLALEYRAITSATGREEAPSLSPDGTLVAYAQSDENGERGRLMLQNTAHVSARALTTPPPGSHDAMPVWSRNGSRIAFVRVDKQGCALMVVAVNGGGERKVGDCLLQSHSQFDWTPDGRGLVMGGLRNPDESNAPLRILDLRTGRWRALDYALADNDIDMHPRYSPDGRWLAFRRNTSLADLWLMPAEGGTPRQLTMLKGDIRGWDWLPDGSGLVFSLVRGDVGLHVYSLVDGSIRRLEGFATGNTVFPDVAAEDWSMVFEIDQIRSAVFRFPLRGADVASGRERLFPSSGIDMLPAVSPDGGMLAFVSDRAMSVQLWIGDIGQPDTLRAIDGLQPVPRHPPVWSPDGRRLLVLGKTDAGDRLFEIDVGSDALRRLPVPSATPAYAAYTGDPQRLLVGVDGGQGRLRLVLYRLPSWEALASIDDVAVARYDELNDQVYFTRPSRRGVWRADAALQNVVQVADRQPDPGFYRQWGIVGGQLYYNGPGDGCETAWQRIFTMPETDGACVARRGAAIAGSPSVDRAGQWLYIGLPLQQNVDVGWVGIEALHPSTPAEAAQGRAGP